jgi:hypothetical protein
MSAAKKKIHLLKSSLFWNKIADVLGLFGTGGLVAIDVNNGSETWTWIVGGATGLVQVIRLLFTDNNKNNIPDILEEQESDEDVLQQEVNVVVTQDKQGGPPVVEVTQEVTTKPEKQ